MPWLKKNGPLVMCEGYATGASIHEATGFAVACAMNCGNLAPVAKALRAKNPDREIIIAADNDQWTEGNPGVTKATETAKAIGAKLAVPQFTDTTTHPTDFNDLHQLQGFAAVKDQMATAEAPQETDEEALARLAKLSLVDYDRCREAEATKLGIRVGTLDDEVSIRRPKTEIDRAQGRAVSLPNVEPWPEPVDLAQVLTEVSARFSRYVFLPESASDALALWCAHAHAFTNFQCSPRLNITSPEKGCGKTTLLDLVSTFVPRSLPTENLTPAVLFRLVEEHSPTVLADECDCWLRDNDELRGLLNGGHRRGGQVYRCEGESNAVRAFNVFSPAVLSGIGTLPGTLHDRSIVVRLVRARPGELRERFDSRRAERETELCRKLARGCADHGPELEALDPALPPAAFNRLADNWRPLFAIAEVAGGDWPQRCAVAFHKLTSSEDADAQGLGVMLLADIQLVFVETCAERLFSKTLVERLNGMSDRPWPEAHRGKPISETWLARRLKSFEVTPRTVRIAENRAKGYELSDFTDAFERFLPDAPHSSRDAVTSPDFTGPNPAFGSVTPPNTVTDQKRDETPANIGLSRCHASEATVSDNELEEALLL